MAANAFISKLFDESGNEVYPVTVGEAVYVGDKQLPKVLDEIINFDQIYPVGSIYMSVNNVNPATLFGGTWEQIKGRFLLGADETYTAGSEGGEATHQLTKEELAPHSHKLSHMCVPVSPKKGAASGSYGQLGNDSTARSTEVEGEGVPHNNMPPYLSVYIWKRTA